MNDNAHTERFVQRLTDRQNELFGYLFAMLGDLHEAREVLQETNLVLWRKMAEFVEGTEFGAWARKIAYFQTLARVRDRRRDRLLFDEDLLKQIAARPVPSGESEERRVALRHCLADLPDDQRELISRRYGTGGSVKSIAQQTGKSESAIKMTLLRIRQRLLGCIRRKLRAQA